MKRFRFLGLVAVLALTGCYEQHQSVCETGCSSTPIDAGPVRRIDLGPRDPGVGGEFEFALRLVSIHVEGPAGRSRGIDLDGRVSTETDPGGCFQADFIDPLSGEVGVENAFGNLKPTIEAALGMEIDPAIEATVTEVPLSLSGVAPGRTDTSIVASVGARSAMTSMREGQFQAVTNAALIVPLGIGVATLQNVGVDARLRPDGTLENAIVTGTLQLEEVVDGVTAAVPDVDPALIRTTLEGIADLEPTGGRCEAVSIVFDARARAL